MSGSQLLSRCRWSLLLLLAALSPVGALANSILYAPAQYYGAQQLWGNLESAPGLWVASAQDPLAYIYGYIPGIMQGGGVSYFGSANFDLIPVLLADPTVSLKELSIVLGNMPLPAGGGVLDLTAAIAAWENSPRTGLVIDAGPTLLAVAEPEPESIWLAIAGGAGLIGLSRRRRKALVEIE